LTDWLSSLARLTCLHKEEVDTNNTCNLNDFQDHNVLKLFYSLESQNILFVTSS